MIFIDNVKPFIAILVGHGALDEVRRASDEQSESLDIEGPPKSVDNAFLLHVRDKRRLKALEADREEAKINKHRP